MHFLSVALPLMVGSVNGRLKWPNAPGLSLSAGVPIAGSVNALTVESGSPCAPASAGNAAAAKIAAAARTTPRRALAPLPIVASCPPNGRGKRLGGVVRPAAVRVVMRAGGVLVEAVAIGTHGDHDERADRQEAQHRGCHVEDSDEVHAGEATRARPPAP